MIFLGYSSYKKIKFNNRLEKKTQQIPAFTFYTPEGTAFTNTNIMSNYATIVICYFHPDCDHCQYMAKEINKHQIMLEHTIFVMVTNSNTTSVNNFIDNNHWRFRENIKVAVDRVGDFYKTFGTTNVPSFFVYNNHGYLKKKVIGETKIENLLN